MKGLLPKRKIPYHKDHRIPHYFRKMLGSYRGLFPKVPSFRSIMWSFIASFAGISLVTALSYNVSVFVSQHLPTMIGSFGASAVLIYGAIDSPLSQPRNFMGGHLISAFIGVSIGKICSGIFNQPDNFLWLQGALSVSLSIVAMQITGTVHPPGGATALIAVTSGSKILDLGYLYMAIPVLFGTGLMLIVALLINNIQRQYPMYWFFPRKPDIIIEDHSDSDSGSNDDSRLECHLDHGEMYEPTIFEHSEAKKAIEHNDDKLGMDILNSATLENNSNVVIEVDREAAPEIDSSIQYKEMAEMYRIKFEEVQAHLKTLEKELEAVRRSHL
ncbi:hypothetical protein K7432_010406 [Basidiobolus ranarum]|uniref:HPP transmembrane region domain-containing protein n=1 Tax=Basidiobolus ranarum TaxID=34480 RepID=A0ABR2VVJ8_9FUNG